MPEIKKDNLVDQYFHEIEDSTGLSAADEAEIALLIQKGDEEALQTLVSANLRFVVSVAKKYQGFDLPLSDLINEGNLGLITAAKRFDGTKGFKFISYAVWWIRQAILQALAEQSRIVRLPLNRIGELVRVNKILAGLEQRLGRVPDVNDIAEELEADADELDLMMHLAQKPQSLDAVYDDDDPSRTVGDLIPDESITSAEDSLFEAEMEDEVEKALASLEYREAQILRLYYGLQGHEEMTLENIGTLLGLTRERVRQIKEKALQRLRHPSSSEILGPYNEAF
ncbi:RNA polymerase subunit sigma [bacterium]|jgi:RNA polymerase primary sigma factor|nr:RNA polymerase subunit sigma [bacterium]|tara:strand:+ start:30849 stop:31697 length:849 start_codon:yes stop_codon:yes gene_type:complete